MVKTPALHGKAADAPGAGRRWRFAGALLAGLGPQSLTTTRTRRFLIRWLGVPPTTAGRVAPKP
jgi:hypothetical protein